MRLTAAFLLIPFLSSLAFADTWTTGTAGQVTTSGTGTRVGVGTTGTPPEKLTVSAGNVQIDNNRYLKGKVAAGTATNLIGLTTGNQLVAGGSGNTSLALSVSNSTRALIDGSGNMGVGTTSPGRRLDVNGTARATAFEGDGALISNVAPIGSVSVRRYGALPGGTNLQGEFQAALNAARDMGGGVVFVPAGRYDFEAPLIIPRGVTLQGSWQGPHDGFLDRGTVLRVTYTAGSTSSAFITLEDDAAVRGVTIHYSLQNSSTTILAYPWTISARFEGKVENVTLTNSFRGIQANLNSHLIRNVNMTALSQGIAVDNCLDISRLENVHIHPKYWLNAMGWAYTSDANGVPSGELWNVVFYTIRNLVAFSFARSDWQEMSGCFVIWARVGFQVNAPAAGGFSGTVVNSAFDMCQIAVEVNHTDSFGGVSFVNTLILGQTLIVKPDIGPVRFTNCTFHPAFQAENPNRTTALVYHDSPGTLSITSSLFYDWDVPRLGNGCVTMNSGVCMFGQNEFMPPGVGRPATVPPPGPERLHFNLFNNAEVVVSATRFGGPMRMFGTSGTRLQTFGIVER